MELFSKQHKNDKLPVTESKNATIILNEAKAGLENQIVRLSKEKQVDLSKHKARIFVIIDRSGSMYENYSNGSVQTVLTRLLPLSLRFDDDGELDVYVFNKRCHRIVSMTLKNYETYVNTVILGQGYQAIGGTSYSPVINETIRTYNSTKYPAFGIFITDGENNDAEETDKAIRESSNLPIFYQFIGIGNSSFKYLEKLDDLDGRRVDNTAFMRVSNFSQLSDDELYSELLEQYTKWLQVISKNK